MKEEKKKKRRRRGTRSLESAFLPRFHQIDTGTKMVNKRRSYYPLSGFEQSWSLWYTHTHGIGLVKYVQKVRGEEEEERKMTRGDSDPVLLARNSNPLGATTTSLRVNSKDLVFRFLHFLPRVFFEKKYTKTQFFGCILCTPQKIITKSTVRVRIRRALKNNLFIARQLPISPTTSYLEYAITL